MFARNDLVVKAGPKSGPARRLPQRDEDIGTNLDLRAVITALLSDDALSYRFKSGQTGDAASAMPSTSESKHRLVIFDAQAATPATPGDTALRFHGVRASGTQETRSATRKWCHHSRKPT